ncbi:MAG: Ig-like domain-containing protein [Lachnospiraceae bacterium]|nr:Ig-like domain-containing protein [Lachnospiraceae bacterium]
MNYRAGKIYKSVGRRGLALFIAFVLMLSTCITSELINSVNAATRYQGMISYTGSTKLYVGESASFSVSVSGTDIVWSSDDGGKYVNLTTSGENNTGTTLDLTVIDAPESGSGTVVITATNTSNEQYDYVELTIASNSMFWFTQGSDHKKITESSIDIPYNGSVILGTNQLAKGKISFGNASGYVHYTGSDESGYTITNDETDTTTSPDNPVVVTAVYEFDSHKITLKLNIQVIDTISLSQQSDITVYKGTDNGPTTFDINATVTNITESITWNVYSGDLTADQCLQLNDATRINPTGFNLTCSTSTANAKVNRQLNDVASVSITKDLDISVYDTYTVLVSQFLYGERSINAICHVHVLQPSVGLTLSQHTAKLFLGGNSETSNSRITVTATLVGEDGVEPEDNTIIWHSTDDSVVSITSNGTACTINAKVPGSCVVVATSKQNPSATDVIYIDVLPKVSSVDITANDMTVNLAEQFVQLFANVQSNAVDETVGTADYETYASALNMNVVWSSNDKNVATVDLHTGKVTLLAAGKVTITCSSADDTKISDSIIITINVPVAQILLQENSKKISVGESFTLYYQLLSNYTGYEPSNKEVSWESSDDKVAVVDNDGKVTGVSGGTATILCRADEGQVTATCTVEVYQAVTRIDLSNTSMELNVGGEAVLEAFVYPATASNQKVTWESNKPDIVSVTEDGVITANELGDPVVITAYIVDKDSTIKATCIVTVVVPITSLTVSPDYKEVNKGDTFLLSTSVTPKAASNKSVVYGSTNPSVCTVNQNGLVTAKAGGDCYITVRSSGNRDMMASTYVVVSEDVSGLKLNRYSKVCKKGAEFQLIATVTNQTASDQDIAWKSSNSSIASVDQDGIVTANKYGTCYITASTMDGTGLSRTCKVTVRRYVKKIKLNYSLAYVKVKGKLQLKATISPTNADIKNVKWVSSNKKIATVNKKGVVTGKKVGNCTITCKATDGSGVKAKCKIYVRKKLTKDMITANRVS